MQLDWITILSGAGLIIFGYLWKKCDKTKVGPLPMMSEAAGYASVWVFCLIVFSGHNLISSKEEETVEKLSQVVPVYPNSEFRSRLSSRQGDSTEFFTYDTDDPPKEVVNYFLNHDLGEWVVESQSVEGEIVNVTLQKGAEFELTIIAMNATGWTPKKPYQISYTLKAQRHN